MSEFSFFWDTVRLCDWSLEGDDDKVLQPVVRYLAAQEDSGIFQFDDQMKYSAVFQVCGPD